VPKNPLLASRLDPSRTQNAKERLPRFPPHEQRSEGPRRSVAHVTSPREVAEKWSVPKAQAHSRVDAGPAVSDTPPTGPGPRLSQFRPSLSTQGDIGLLLELRERMGF